MSYLLRRVYCGAAGSWKPLHSAAVPALESPDAPAGDGGRTSSSAVWKGSLGYLVTKTAK